MLKILENSNRNHTFSALLNLLLYVPPEAALGLPPGVAQDASGGGGNLALRWADLVVK